MQIENMNDYRGDMCGKCLHMDLSDYRGLNSFYCPIYGGGGSEPWNSTPCSNYIPDNSMSRIEAIERARIYH